VYFLPVLMGGLTRLPGMPGWELSKFMRDFCLAKQRIG
jgi:hypothetical protein